MPAEAVCLRWLQGCCGHMACGEYVGAFGIDGLAGIMRLIVSEDGRECPSAPVAHMQSGRGELSAFAGGDAAFPASMAALALSEDFHSFRHMAKDVFSDAEGA